LVDAPVAEIRVEQVKSGRKVVAEIQIDGERVSVRFGAGVLDAAGVARLRAFIAEQTGSQV
jgi:hypothetical protein